MNNRLLSGITAALLTAVVTGISAVPAYAASQTVSNKFFAFTDDGAAYTAEYTVNQFAECAVAVLEPNKMFIREQKVYGLIKNYETMKWFVSQSVSLARGDFNEGTTTVYTYNQGNLTWFATINPANDAPWMGGSQNVSLYMNQATTGTKVDYTAWFSTGWPNVKNHTNTLTIYSNGVCR